MSKLIVEMEMKDRCIDCQVRLACKRYIKKLQTMDGIEKMRKKIGSDDCIIKGVLPDEHGDLIDRDALKEKKVYSHERHEHVVPVACIDWQDAVIEAERQTE